MFIPNMKKHYKENVMPYMMQKFSYKNIMQVPRLEKIVINVGMAEGATDIKILDSALEELAAITGQKGVITRAKNQLLTLNSGKASP